MAALEQYFKRLHSDHWGVLEVMIADHSPIDLSRLSITDRRDAYLFIRNYGFDLNHPDDAAEVERIQAEAMELIQKLFLDTLELDFKPLKMPPSIQQADIIDLLLLASSNPRAVLQKWACAMLRVMHTLAHVSTDLSASFFPDIQDQILRPYYEHIFREEGQLWLGKGQDRLPLVEFEVKAGKERSSAVLKLLHKRENVAADIFDRIGVRFVTRDRLDAILVLRYLREKHLVPFPNVKPSRSVNTLIHIDKLRRTFRELYAQYKDQKLEDHEFEQILRHSAQFRDTLSSRQIHTLFNRNPFTSRQYRAMQFTVRQLVKLRNPLYPFKDQIDASAISDIFLQRQFEDTKPYYRFFFPYEIQIVDLDTHRNNMSGQARHDIYKHRQLVVARKRVLGALLKPVQEEQPLADEKKRASKKEASAEDSDD